VDRVTAGPWLDVQGVGLPLAEAAPPWDYTTTLSFSREFDVDLPGLLQDCALPSSAQLAVCVRYSTSRSRLRTLCTQEPLPRSGALEAWVNGADLGGVLTMETTVELAEDVRPPTPFVAHRAGSILWRETTSSPLEGDGGLLPVAPVPFTEHGYLPPSAAWHVSLDSTEWHHAAMGSLLVLLNTDNPGVKEALLGKADEAAAEVLWDTLQVDVVADLVGKAMDDPDFPLSANDDGPRDATLAGLVESLLRGYLCEPNETVQQALHRLRDVRSTDPSMYRAFVQDGLRYLGSAAR
jgi:hypothetical protein